MNCRKVQNLISAYLDGELAGHEMLLVRHHLSGCGECSVEYESLLTTKRAFGRLHPKRPSDDLAARICSRLSEVHIPPHVKLLMSLSRYVHQFPAGVKVGAVGVAVLAALLLVRGGDVSVGSRFASIPVSSETLQTFAALEPVRPATTSMPGYGLPQGAAAYPVEFHGWRLTPQQEQAVYGPSTGGIVLVDHSW